MGAAGLMVGSAVVGGAGGYLGAKADGDAAKKQARFNRQQAEWNAREAEREAEFVLKKSQKDASQYMKDVGATIGAQRVALAAQGIVVDDATAATVQEQTREIGLEDALTIRQNAMREAYGLKSEAMNFRLQAQFDEAAAIRGSANARMAGLLSGVAGVGSSIASAKSQGMFEKKIGSSPRGSGQASANYYNSYKGTA